MSNIESERSWLVKKLPAKGLDLYEKVWIVQSYTTNGLRLRRYDDTFELTQKKVIDKNDLSRREESTLFLTRKEYDILDKAAGSRRLYKTRYKIPLENGLIAELDIFEEALQGFMKVEVEFVNDLDRANFQPPVWFGREITNQDWQQNSYLAGRSFQDILPFIKAADDE